MGHAEQQAIELEVPFSLPEEAITAYRTVGHVRLSGVAAPAMVQAHRPVIQEIVTNTVDAKNTQGRISDYSSLFLQVTNVWRLDDRARQFVLASRFAGIAARLMGVSAVRIYHDQALFKPPGGKATPWHQDQFYWPLDTTHTITMWMPLVDVTSAMGTMSFADGSHRDGPLLARSISESTHREFEALIADRGYRVSHYDTLQAGDATFHAGWTVHSAHANRSPSPREVLTVIYYADGTQIKEPENEYQVADLAVFHPGQHPGEPAASALNPLIRFTS